MAVQSRSGGEGHDSCPYFTMLFNIAHSLNNIGAETGEITEVGTELNSEVAHQKRARTYYGKSCLQPGCKGKPHVLAVHIWQASEEVGISDRQLGNPGRNPATDLFAGRSEFRTPLWITAVWKIPGASVGAPNLHSLDEFSGAFAWQRSLLCFTAIATLCSTASISSVFTVLRSFFDEGTTSVPDRAGIFFGHP